MVETVQESGFVDFHERALVAPLKPIADGHGHSDAHHFHERAPVAPLKHAVPGACDGVALFPRARARGPIEAVGWIPGAVPSFGISTSARSWPH